MLRASALPFPHIARGPRLARFVLWAAALALTAFVWVHAIQSLTNPHAVRAKVRPQAFVWGDRVFDSRAKMEQWLKARGVSYDGWAKRHPAALGILYPKRVHHRAPTAAEAKHSTGVAAQKPSAPKPHAVAVAASPAADSGSGSTVGAVINAGIVALPIAGLLVAAGSTVHARWRRRRNPLLAFRLHVVAAAAACAIGALLAHAM